MKRKHDIGGRKRSSLSEMYREGVVRRIKQKQEKDEIEIFKQKHALFVPLFPFILKERMITYRSKVFDVLSLVLETDILCPLFSLKASESGTNFSPYSL